MHADNNKYLYILYIIQMYLDACKCGRFVLGITCEPIR